MTWYWYVARPDELMIDCDSQVLLEIAMKRIERCELAITKVFAAPSQTKGHFHLVIRLRDPLVPLRRAIWQLFFMDHVYRSFKNLMRVVDGGSAPILLISPEKWKSFWRIPDATCQCARATHKDERKIKKCPQHKRLRGG